MSTLDWTKCDQCGEEIGAGKPRIRVDLSVAGGVTRDLIPQSATLKADTFVQPVEAALGDIHWCSPKCFLSWAGRFAKDAEQYWADGPSK